jgi:hypothetical protein
MIERNIIRQRKNVVMTDCNFVGEAPLPRPEYTLTTLEFASLGNGGVLGDSSSEL